MADSSPDSGPTVSDTIAHMSDVQGDIGSELFVLATNFLLYVCLIVITILMQKFYFPHTLYGLPAEYEVAATADDEEGAAIELEEPPEADVAEVGSGDSEEGDSALGKPRATPRAAPIRSPSQRALASLVDFNFDQSQSTKQEVITRLATCFLGLNISFVMWGVLQERMLTKPYTSSTDPTSSDYFDSSYGLVFLNRLGGFFISAVLVYFSKTSNSGAIIYEFSYPSVSNMLSSWCQYEALKYVTFPTQMLFKCFKLLPIMVMGKLLGNKDNALYDYGVALSIGGGIAIFMVSSEKLELGHDSIGNLETWSGTWCGLLLLMLFLIFDSFTGQWQAKMFREYPALSPTQMMFGINAFSMVFSLITLLHTHELEPACQFVYDHPEMHIHLVLFSICSTFGQLFIFHTIRNFGAVVFAIAMNTRIILSIVLSCIVYAHPITSSGYLGLFIVFASIVYRIKRKTEGRNLIKWKDQDEDNEVFHEWHEHCDM